MAVPPPGGGLLTRLGFGGGAPAAAAGAATSLPLKLFGAGAVLAAAWMIRDSYVGSRSERQRRVDQLKIDNDYRYSQFDWGKWSGNQSTDRAAHKLFGFIQYGPWSIREKFNGFCIRVSDFFNNVIAPNLIPLGVGIAGLYGAGIKVHKPFVDAFTGASKLIGPNFFPALGTWCKDWLIKPMGTGLFNLAKFPFSSVPALGISLGTLCLGSFFMKRLSDSYGEDGTRNFFRNDIYR